MGLYWLLVRGASEPRLPLPWNLSRKVDPWDLPLAGGVAEHVQQFRKQERDAVRVPKRPGFSFPFASCHLCDKQWFWGESIPKCRDKLCVKASRLEMLNYQFLVDTVWICDLLGFFSFIKAWHFCCKKHAFFPFSLKSSCLAVWLTGCSSFFILKYIGL